MPDVRFTHPQCDPTSITIRTGANQITWGYGLNTLTTPTYGGEVVQILSAYVEDLMITGDVKTYNQMENIYGWFLQYIQVASQGQGPNFDETPILFEYPERGWHLKVRVNSLPGYRKATDVVAPTWQIQAAVVEGDPAMNELTRQAVINKGTGSEFDFNRLHGGIGYDEDNPFTNALAGVTQDGKPAGKDAYDPQQFAGEIADFYQSLLPSYLEGDFDSLFDGDAIGSKPTSKDKKKDKGDQQETVMAPSINSVLGGEGL